MTAAEAQGHLCGLLAAAGETTQAFWVEQVFGGLDSVAAGCPHCEPPLSRLYAWTRAALRSEALALALFLPEDAAPMTARIQALRAWCQGFLSGVGLGCASVETLPEAVEEVLQDMAELTQVSEEPDGDEEGDEQAYAEIVEYLRAGVWLVAEELGGAREHMETTIH